VYKRNYDKAEMITLYGAGYDLPLFNQGDNKAAPAIKQPDWLWNGEGIKAEVLEKMKNKFSEDKFIYLNALIAIGGRGTDHEVKEYLDDIDRWPLHIVSARRNDLMKSPFFLVTSYPDAKKRGPKGMPNTVWFINYKNLQSLLL